MDMASSDWLDLDYVILATTSIIGSFIYYLSKSEDKAILNLQNAPNVEVGSSLQTLLKTDMTFPFIAIRGAVKELGTQIIKSDSGVTGVLQMITVNEHSMRRYGNGFWGGAVREIVHTFNDVPFGLRSMTEPGPMIVEIVDPMQAMQEHLLSPVSTKFTPAIPGLVSSIMGYVMGNTSTGIATTEQLLSVDTNVTAVGQLIARGDKFRLMTTLDKKNFPYILSTYPLEHIIERMVERRRGIRIIAFIFYSIATVSAMRKVWKLWKAYEEKQMRARILQDRRERAERLEANRNRADAADIRNATSDVDLRLCVVCLNNPREVILLPCGHVVVCVDCMERLNGTCPLCRMSFSRTHAAYVS